MDIIDITNMQVIHGLFVEYSKDGKSDFIVFDNLCNDKNKLEHLIHKCRNNNDFDIDSLKDIISDFVCEQSL